MSMIITTRSGKQKDMTLVVRRFFEKKFGYNFQKKLQNKQIPQDQLDAVKPELDQILQDARND